MEIKILGGARMSHGPLEALTCALADELGFDATFTKAKDMWTSWPAMSSGRRLW